MIKDKQHAAAIAARIAVAAIDTPSNQKIIGKKLAERQTEFFYETRLYRFTAESFWLHQCGKGVFDYGAGWASVDDSLRLALTVYCAMVPILAGFIPQEELPKRPASPPTPGRGFEKLTDDDSNRGTIYERENFGIGRPPPAPQTISGRGGESKVAIDEGDWGGDVIEENEGGGEAEDGEDEDDPPPARRKQG